MSTAVSTSTTFFENPYGDPHIIKNGRFTDVTPITMNYSGTGTTTLTATTQGGAIRFSGSSTVPGALGMFITDKKYKKPKKVCCTYNIINSGAANILIFGLNMVETIDSFPAHANASGQNGPWTANAINGSNGSSKVLISPTNATSNGYNACTKITSGVELDISSLVNPLNPMGKNECYLALSMWIWNTQPNIVDISDLYIEY